jgi:hypothetical protein
VMRHDDSATFAPISDAGPRCRFAYVSNAYIVRLDVDKAASNGHSKLMSWLSVFQRAQIA